MSQEIITILLIPFLGTMLGSAFVFFMRKEMPTRLQKLLLGFSSGVMVAASVWSLLMPSMELNEGMGKMAIVPTTVGFLIGMGFLLLLDLMTPHLHFDSKNPEGPKSHLSQTAMLTLAVTLHNLPEGMAVGVVLAGAMQGTVGISEVAAATLALGIAIQNVPEGAIISMPLRAAGNSRWKSFLIGSMSGIVEPVGGALVLLLASVATATMPYLLPFAAGAMLYVVVEELVPELSEGAHSNVGTVAFSVGFAAMTALDRMAG